MHPGVIQPTGRQYRLPEHRYPRGQGRSAPILRPKKNSFWKDSLELVNTSRLSESVLQDARARAVALALAGERLAARALLEALRAALAYGLSDLERVERMVLRKFAWEYFQVNPGRGDGDDDEGGDSTAL